MPRAVDPAVRLRQIDSAVLHLVAHEGIAAVTFRRVAAELGASTTAVTHFVPDRETLLDRAFSALRAEVAAAITAAEAHPAPLDRLRALLVGGLPLAGDAAPWQAYGNFQTAGGRAAWTLAAAADVSRLRGAIDGALAALPLRAPRAAALDLCATLIDGISASVLVEPAAWPAERQRATVDALLSALVAGPDGRVQHDVV